MGFLNKITDSQVNFPLWTNDGKPTVGLDNTQKSAILDFLDKIDKGEYKMVNNTCLCGGGDDLLVSQKDRFGIPINIVLCKECGLIRTEKRLDDESTRKFYEADYRLIYVGYDQAQETFFDEQRDRGEYFLSLVSKFADIDNIKNVFEIGCGAGGILYPFHQINKHVSGCDFGYKYIQYGKSKGMDLYAGDINPGRTPHNSQDLIIMSHVMEHINEPIKYMNNVVYYIKQNGYLLVEVPGIFDIPKTYYNPILFFQNAHVYNYYAYYLRIFFESIGLKVLYGDERCTFLLQKPEYWNERKITHIKKDSFKSWAKLIEYKLKVYYLMYKFKFPPNYYIRRYIISMLTILGVKNFIKVLVFKFKTKFKTKNYD